LAPSPRWFGIFVPLKTPVRVRARWATIGGTIGGTIYFVTRYATSAVIGRVMGRSFNSHSANTGFMIELTTIRVALDVVILVGFRSLSNAG
jgi:hypothetical protein